MSEVERLRAVLQAIADGEEPRPVGIPWRNDGQPSKNDRCIHDQWMWEDCGSCIAEFASHALHIAPALLAQE